MTRTVALLSQTHAIPVPCKTHERTEDSRERVAERITSNRFCSAFEYSRSQCTTNRWRRAPLKSQNGRAHVPQKTADSADQRNRRNRRRFLAQQCEPHSARMGRSVSVSSVILITTARRAWCASQVRTLSGGGRGPRSRACLPLFVLTAEHILPPTGQKAPLNPGFLDYPA